MFTIEERRENNRATLVSASFVARIAAMALVVIIIVGPSTASARRPPTPQNFHVTATTAYTVTVAWDSAPPNSGDFNYHLSGAYGVTPAILPKTATSHTFTRLHSGNEYWFFIYARNAGGQVSTTTRTLLDTTAPSTGPVVRIRSKPFRRGAKPMVGMSQLRHPCHTITPIAIRLVRSLALISLCGE
jgi:Fibronectin type III domain